ncbi:hypothetical protein LLG95_12900 [bacterium]|nr:hypothetical protein [bacterium]
MIGSVTARFERGVGVQRLLVTWTADANGVAELDMRGVLPDGSVLNRLEVSPSASAPPTANYDVTLPTLDIGADLLGGLGLNRSATAIEAVPLRTDLTGNVRWMAIQSQACRLRIDNAGAGGSGLLAIYMSHTLRN